MSYTPVQNRFWSDGWVRGLNALDRYLFLYLLTNGRGNLVGIYELPLDLMASESGIDEKDLRLSMLQRLEPKVFYKDGWVIMVNYLKHRVSDSPKYVTGILNQFSELPSHIQEIAKSVGYPIDTLSIGNRIRIDKIRKDISEVGTSRRIVSDTSEQETPPKRQRKYPHSEEIYSLFASPDISWKINTSQLKAAEQLFERGVDNVKKYLSFVKKYSNEEDCPQILSPYDLNTKWLKIQAFHKRLNK